MKVRCLIALFVITALSAKGQSDTIYSLERHCKGLYRDCRSGSLNNKESTIGLVPEVQLGSFSKGFGIAKGLQFAAVGLSIAKGRFNHGEWGGDGWGYSLGATYFTQEKAFSAGAGVWKSIHIIFMGPTVSLKANYYRYNNTGSWAFRPQIGINIFQKIFLLYGYTLFISDVQLVKGLLSISYYHTILPRKKK